jgi:hypothetical protein
MLPHDSVIGGQYYTPELSDEGTRLWRAKIWRPSQVTSILEAWFIKVLKKPCISSELSKKHSSKARHTKLFELVDKGRIKKKCNYQNCQTWTYFPPTIQLSPVDIPRVNFYVSYSVLKY